ncbi:ATP-binding cassette domain-containing protein [Bradyrhizobium sp.]|uniref:branched-chain amino acid ABC transporter ATP-binding protein/permease n=1 Tax=Bradyrhizobium sp. TaxID=376 RepID=UPI00260B0BC2|nr:ATP-binding cassette domain-containing protein [Bradyrhizobium sp.]
MKFVTKVLLHPILVAGVVFAVLPLVLPLVGSSASLATEIAIYALYGLGFNLLLGYTGLVSFGASAFFGAASYAAGLSMLYFFDNIYLSIIFGTVTSAVLGLVIGLLILRRRGIYFSLLTLAFTQLFYEIAFKWTDVTGGENGLQGISRNSLLSPLAYHYFVVAMVLCGMYAIWRIVHSPFGRVLQAIRDNEQRVRCLGYDTKRFKLIAFVLSSTFIGLGGSLLTFMIQSVYADNLNWQHAGDPVMMTILGGIHHFLGSSWGAVIFLTLSDKLSSYTEHWWLIFGLILIAFILLSPEGVSGIWMRLRGRGDRWTLTDEAIPPPGKFTSLLDIESVASVAADAPVLEVRGLSKRFGSLVVADKIDLTVKARTLHTIIGPNGAGKTTFFNILTGLMSFEGGTASFLGRDITHMEAHKRIDSGLARSFQIVSVFKHLTVFETVRVAAQARSPYRTSLWRDAYRLPDVCEKAWALLATVGLVDRAHERCANLAHGEQRLLEIAVALATNPELLLLDEPLAGLGDADRERIGTLIRNLSRHHTVLLIEHDIDRVLSLSDQITVFHQGHVIAEGEPSKIANDPAVLEAYLGRHGARRLQPAAATVSRADRSRLLTLKGIGAGYNTSDILQNVDLEVREGEVVALLGRNGVGKTTTLMTIMGLLKPSRGTMTFAGHDIASLSPDQVNKRGIAIVPEGRRIFPNLTVDENLTLAQRDGGWPMEEIYGLFPKLKTRRDARGENLSGGERQMLAIGRALCAPQRLILLDEPFEGLAPSVVAEVLAAIEQLRDKTSILLVEHKVDLVLDFADRAYVMVNGQIAYTGESRALRDDVETQTKFLGVG